MWIPGVLFVALSSVALTLGAVVDSTVSLERDEVIEAVNNAKTTWKAGRNFHPSAKTSYARNLLGLKRHPGGRRLPVLEDDGEDIELPKSFDARDKWSTCDSLMHIRDQGPCGSCWAVGSSSAFSDRLCIATEGSFNGYLSAEEVVSCCTSCGDGCDGGYDDEAWEYFASNGLVTGGDYKSKEGCQPYTLPACEHHTTGTRKNCSSYGDLPTPKCRKTCYNKKYKDHTFAEDHHKLRSAFTINNDVKKTQKEIFKNGPVEAGFEVYEDFLSYKSGVYQHVAGEYKGGHAVRVLGWGVEDGTPYWLVANSWNTDWGDNGLFKIKRGNNECDFESDISGGYPDT